MRMGNTFSRALDPKKPLLFGDFPLDILEEEVWHPTARRLAWQDPLTSLTSNLSPEQTSVTASTSPAANPSADGEASGKLAEQIAFVHPSFEKVKGKEDSGRTPFLFGLGPFYIFCCTHACPGPCTDF